MTGAVDNEEHALDHSITSCCRSYQSDQQQKRSAYHLDESTQPDSSVFIAPIPCTAQAASMLSVLVIRPRACWRV